ncbi:diacylglycerol kinase epsilon [Condylostylus longicornis]|uniref:diacylglycerol kinase epsilon n=1 Tax=Condylostylus longicornis TaxID=2530218 RepID=UPI00244DDB58|nr:diacylglycerol kinase epsilon [Condylostylus longicornis]
MEGVELSFEALIGSFLALLLLFFFCRSLLIENVVYIPGKKRHGWKPVRILERACYCSVCEMLLPPSTGLFCDSCGVCSHPSCTKKADSNFKCKEKYLKNEKSIIHLWVKGNLPLHSECFECHEDIESSIINGLVGYRCCWCQRTFHNNCYKKFDINSECDFGEFKDMIYPPNCILAARTRGAIKLHLTGIKPPNIENWKPLIVIANTKSGSNTASDVVALLRGILHPLQVMELGRRGPADALQWAAVTGPRACRILIAGGDGTIGWVLNTIFSLEIKPIPEVAIIPLGTGNDLSRVLGWGSEPPTELNPTQILRNIRCAKSVSLDRFIMEVEVLKYRLPIHKPPIKTIYMYSYFSIGVDALVTYNFHKTRESKFYLLSSRIFNKLIYFGFGTQQIVQRDCENIEKRFELYLDNKLVELPELQSIVFLNIDSWGAGVKLCELSRTDCSLTDLKNSISDGLIEVFGIVSSFHIAQLQVGISKPIRIGQAKHIRILMKQTCPMQADGEPWMQLPCDIRIQARGQARMLKFRNM